MYKVTCYYKHSFSRTFQAIEEYYITNGMLYLKNTDDYAWYLPLKSISEIQINPYKEDKIRRIKMDKEKALKIWLPVIADGVKDLPECKEALEMAIKALEQEPVIDKIRAEIIELRSRQNVGVLECLDIIDKYKAESEG